MTTAIIVFVLCLAFLLGNLYLLKGGAKPSKSPTKSPIKFTPPTLPADSIPTSMPNKANEDDSSTKQ